MKNRHWQAWILFKCLTNLIIIEWCRWYAALGMFDISIKHMLEVLVCSHQSKATQELFLRDFLQIVQVSVLTKSLYDVLTVKELVDLYINSRIFHVVLFGCYRKSVQLLRFWGFSCPLSSYLHSRSSLKIIELMHLQQL